MDEHKECVMCGRKLKNVKSRIRGYGRSCWKKYNEQKAKEEFERKQCKLEM